MSIDFSRRKIMLGLLAFPATFYLSRAFSNTSDTDADHNQVITVTNKEYGKLLNSVATLVMGYYGFILDKNTNNRQSYLLSDALTLSFNDEIRSELNGITIHHAELLNDSNRNELQFNVDATIQYTRNQQRYQQQIKEQFRFSRQTTTAILAVKRLTSDEVVAVVSELEHGNDLTYYQQRQWIYAWAAYLNGINSTLFRLNQDNLNTINYQLILGQPKFNGTLPIGLEAQKERLGEGQYLLREVSPQPTNNESKIVVLYFDYNGQKDGIPVIANIEQTIDYQILANSQIKINNVIEKHLIPNPQPWQNILC